MTRVNFSKTLVGKTDQVITILGTGIPLRDASPVTGSSYNTFIGTFAGKVNVTSGIDNTFVGYQAGQSNDVGPYNLFIGYQAGLSNTSGMENTFVGYEAGQSNTIGSENTYVGFQVGFNTTGGSGNTFIGYQTGFNNTSGTNNTFIGYQTGFNNTVGNNNTFIGLGAGYGTQSGSSTVCVGTFAGAMESSSSKLYIANTSTAIPLIGGYFSGLCTINNPVPTASIVQSGTIFAIGGSISLKVTLTSSSITLGSGDYFVRVNTNTSNTITLPDATKCSGRFYEIMMITSGNAITVNTTSSQTINNSSLTKTLASGDQFQNIRVFSDGLNWAGNLLNAL